jgi:hypothetical protein
MFGYSDRFHHIDRIGSANKRFVVAGDGQAAYGASLLHDDIHSSEDL